MVPARVVERVNTSTYTTIYHGDEIIIVRTNRVHKFKKNINSLLAPASCDVARFFFFNVSYRCSRKPISDYRKCRCLQSAHSGILWYIAHVVVYHHVSLITSIRYTQLTCE